MGRLPGTARTFILAIWALGTALAVSLYLLQDGVTRFDLWEWALLIPFSVAIGGKKITVGGKQETGDAKTISLSFVAVFACLLWLGPLGGLLAAVLGCLATCLVRREQPAYQIAFNVAIAVCETWAAERVLFVIGKGYLASSAPTWYIAIPLAGASMFAVSAVGVGVVVALCTKTSALQQVRSVFWALPSYVAGASVAAVGTLLFHEGGRSASVGGMLLFLAPTAVLAFQAYRIYVSREEERRKRIEDLQANRDRLAELYLATIRSLALAIDAKDQYTHQHILRVQRYAMAIADAMGLKGDDRQGLETGALLHDIGKLGVPEYILLKPGKLTPDEFDKIKKHPEIGAAILDPVPFPWPVLPVVKYHHEKWDGTGYPEGLAGENIPFTARILAVADVYDALTSSRSYREAWAHERALAYVRESAGTHFDPAIVGVFERVIGGVIEEMAREGQGPLAIACDLPSSENKADVAARDIKRASSELWALYEVLDTLSQRRELRESLQLFAEKLASFRPGSTCVLTHLDAPGNPIVETAYGPEAERFLGATVAVGELPTRLALERSAVYRGAFVPGDLTGAVSELQSALIVPIVYENATLGTIHLYHPLAEAFSAQDAQFLERIAERAAQAIFQGAAFDRTQTDALTDPLTGLYNVRFLQRKLAELCRGETPFSALCLDLDDFKPINDTFGHAAGDEILRNVAALLRENVRAGDTVVRYGGDEFVILLIGTERAGARRVSRAIEAAVDGYDPGLIDIIRGKFRLGASVGVACFPDDSRVGTELLASADARMYARKHARKNRTAKSRAA